MFAVQLTYLNVVTENLASEGCLIFVMFVV